MNRTASLTLALISVMGLCEASVLAQTSVAVLGIESLDAPVNRAACLTEILKREVQKAPGFTLVPGKDLDEVKLVFGCTDEKPACMARAGKSLQTARLMWGSLKKSGGGFVLTIKLLDVANSKLVKRTSESIDQRALDDNCASDAVGNIARSMFSTNKGSIKIGSNVPGARVMLGPTVIGMTYDMPIVLKDLPPGRYKIQVRKEKYNPWERMVEIKGGQVLELTATLTEIGKGPDQPGGEDKGGSGRTGWKIAFWTSAAITVGMATGMGVSGAQVLGIQDEKDDFVNKYRDEKKNYHLLKDDQDVCNLSSTIDAGYQPEINDICTRGKNKATLTNVFLGLTLAAAAASGFFYYKAYMGSESPAPEAKEGDQQPPKEEASASVRWMLSPTAGPEGAGLGFHLEF